MKIQIMRHVVLTLPDEVVQEMGSHLNSAAFLIRFSKAACIGWLRSRGGEIMIAAR
jgi:hypothetical protein